MTQAEHDRAVLGTRTLDAVDASGQPRLLKIEIMIPEQVAAEEWVCRLNITHDGRVSSTTLPIRGGDAIQALVLGLKVIAGTLEGYQRLHGWKLSWHGDSDLGFGEL